MALELRYDAMMIRGPRAGEGARVAGLWKELWDIHESWGSYPGSRESGAYDEVAKRTDRDAEARAGEPLLGQHIHLVATHEGEVVGQVEGWLDRLGYRNRTPFTCEVRSLVVSGGARKLGAGRALLAGLARIAATATRSATYLVAEVLEANPAHRFYERAGFRSIGHSLRFDGTRPIPPLTGAGFRARAAMPSDALPLVLLDMKLAERRLALGDLRFDGPKSLDATYIGLISSHLAATYRDPSEFVVVDAEGNVRAAASLAVTALDSPFLPGKRAMVGRIAVDPVAPEDVILAPLFALARDVSARRGSRTLEVGDLGSPGEKMYQAGRCLGANPWSRIVGRLEPAP